MKRRIRFSDIDSGEPRAFIARRRMLRLLISAGLLAGLLGAPTTAVAADPVPLPEGVRADIVTYWRTGGTGLREAAEEALLGGDEAVRKFLQDAESIQNTDNRIESARLAMTSGPYVREAAVAALQKTPTEGHVPRGGVVTAAVSIPVVG
ncbi:ALF repeat-containing protein [Streptomyces sp. SAI-041]|uniref:ALF repeat-containing protein n=1 Tax=Streptomyces sp. SAI-041 TaxID=2940548 RepID=UPI0024760A21|nr:ALF repeat-containing protein [Streptomyces sp. SAI-041]MDH6554954.1 hypothetical protein [Streptomyces sp. SAI-041]